MKYKKIFVLGSGFSKSISSSASTIKDLSCKLIKEKNRSSYGVLIDFINNIKKISNNSEEILNIEKIATLILSKNIFYNKEENIRYDTLRHQLLSWIFNKIESTSPHIDRDKKEKLVEFLEKCGHNSEEKAKEPSLLMTLNYDLLLERLLDSSNSEYSFDYIVRLNKYLNENCIKSTKNKNIEYLKLHGSFNWFAAPNSMSIDLSNVFLVKDDDPSKGLIHNKDIPAFVPMSFNKMQFLTGSLYSVLWSIGRRYLEEAEEIVFIGYGFPETDTDTLLSFLQFKDKIKEIVVYEKRNSSEIKRLEKLFPKTKIRNQDAFKYIVDTYL